MTKEQEQTQKKTPLSQSAVEGWVIRCNDLYLTREYGVFCWGYKHSARIYKHKKNAEKRAEKVNADCVEAL